MKFILQTQEKYSKESKMTLGLLLSIILTQTLLLIFNYLIAFIVLTLLFMLGIIYIMLFTSVDNKIISAISKNVMFIDNWSIGHFLFGFGLIIVYQLFIVDSLLNSILFSLIISSIFEVFEFLMYLFLKKKEKKDGDIFFLIRWLERENITHFYKTQMGIHDESMVNMFLSDNYFVLIGSILGFCFGDFLINIVVFIGMVGLFGVCRWKLVQNFRHGIIKVIR
jgi:hypothetical protein